MASKSTEIFSHPHIGEIPSALSMEHRQVNIPPEAKQSVSVTEDRTEQIISEFIAYLKSRDAMEAEAWEARHAELQAAVAQSAILIRTFISHDSRWTYLNNAQVETNVLLGKLIEIETERSLSWWKKLERWFRG
jgi:hypothetical protein